MHVKRLARHLGAQRLSLALGGRISFHLNVFQCQREFGAFYIVRCVFGCVLCVLCVEKRLLLLFQPLIARSAYCLEAYTKLRYICEYYY